MQVWFYMYAKYFINSAIIANFGVWLSVMITFALVTLKYCRHEMSTAVKERGDVL